MRSTDQSSTTLAMGRVKHYHAAPIVTLLSPEDEYVRLAAASLGKYWPVKRESDLSRFGPVRIDPRG
jgi:hypothetical protein